MGYKNPEDAVSYGRAYYWKNRERILERQRKRRQTLTTEKTYEYHVRWSYGLELSDIARMRASQDNRCFICEEEKKLVVDHDHKTNQVRGLLCSKCNIGLGHFKDDPSLIQKAIDYLSR